MKIESHPMHLSPPAKPLSRKKQRELTLATWRKDYEAAVLVPGPLNLDDLLEVHRSCLRCVDHLGEALKMLEKQPAKLPMGGGEQTVCTPRCFFDFLNDLIWDRYGARFGIDLAANPENALCERYFTEQDDSLAQPWHEHTNDKLWGFNNPPFSNATPWVAKPRIEVELGARAGQLLKMAIGSDWFQQHVKGGKCLVLRMHGRLPFVGFKGAGANFDTCVILWDGQPYREEDWNWRLDMARWAVANGRTQEVLDYSGMKVRIKTALAEAKEQVQIGDGDF